MRFSPALQPAMPPSPNTSLFTTESYPVRCSCRCRPLGLLEDHSNLQQSTSKSSSDHAVWRQVYHNSSPCMLTHSNDSLLPIHLGSSCSLVRFLHEVAFAEVRAISSPSLAALPFPRGFAISLFPEPSDDIARKHRNPRQNAVIWTEYLAKFPYRAVCLVILHRALAWNCFHSLAGLRSCVLQCFHRVLSVTREDESSHSRLLNEPSNELHALLRETHFLHSCSCSATAPVEHDRQMRCRNSTLPHVQEIREDSWLPVLFAFMHTSHHSA